MAEKKSALLRKLFSKGKAYTVVQAKSISKPSGQPRPGK